MFVWGGEGTESTVKLTLNSDMKKRINRDGVVAVL